MIDWTKPQLCPQGTKHPSEFAPIEAGSILPSGSRIKAPLSVEVLKGAVGYFEKVEDLFENLDDGLVVARIRYDEEKDEPYRAPAGALIELPQPAVGLRHKAIFEVLPDDYTEKKWGLDPEHSHPRVKCSVCGATFRKAALEESLAKK